MQLCSKLILNDQKNILSNKIHQLRIERCRPKAEPKSKYPIKFADIYKSDECINNDNKFPFKNVIFLTIEYKVYMKILQKHAEPGHMQKAAR